MTTPSTPRRRPSGRAGGTLSSLVSRLPTALRGRWLEFEQAETTALPDFILDLNQADWPELMLLPGVGETMARRIVTFRTEHGPFSSVESLRRVPGIGPRTWQRLAPHIRTTPQLAQPPKKNSQ